MALSSTSMRNQMLGRDAEDLVSGAWAVTTDILLYQRLERGDTCIK